MFHRCRICMTDFREWWQKAPLPSPSVSSFVPNSVNDIINGTDINFSNNLLNKKLLENISVNDKLYILLQRIQNYCVLGSIK